MPNVSISITADVADVNTKSELLKSALRGMNSELKALADAAVAAGGKLDSSTLGPLQALADKAAATRREISQLNAEQRRLGEGGGSGLSGISRGLEQVEGSIASVTGMFGRLGTILTAGFGVDRLLDLNRSALELGETLDVTSRKTGLTIQQLVGLKYAAEQNHVSLDQMQAALRGLGQTVEEAISKPTSKAAEAYQQLGISTDFLKANQNDEMAILLRVADAYQHGGTAIQQMANAQLIMTRGGREIIPVLQAGSSGILAYIEAGNKLAPITKEQIEALHQESKAVTDLNTAWEAVKVSAAAAASPSLTPKLDLLSKALSGDSDASWNLAKSLLAVKDGARGNDELLPRLVDKLRSLTTWFSSASKAADQYVASERAVSGIGGVTLPMPPPLPKGPQDAAEGGGARGGFGGDTGRSAWKDLPDLAGQKAALAEWVHNLEAAFRDRQAALKNDITAEIALQQQLEDQLRAKGGVQASVLSEAHMRETELWNQLQQQQVRTAEETANQEIAIANKAAAEQIAAAKLAFAQHKTTLDEETAAILAAEDKRYAAIKAALEKELTTAGLTAAQRTEIENRLTEAYITDQEKMEQAATQAAEKSAQEWRSVTSSIESAFSGAVTSIISGKEKIGQAFVQMTGKLILDFASAVAKMIAQWALFQAVTAAGWTKMASAIGNPLQGGGLLGSLFGGGSSAAQTAATTANTAATTAATAAATAETASTTANTAALVANTAAITTNSVSHAIPFASGAWNLESDMLALVHKGEMIVPANDAPFARSIFSGDLSALGPLRAPAPVLPFPALSANQNSSPLAATGTGDHYSVYATIVAMDTQTGAAAFRQQLPNFARQLAAHHRNGGFSGTPLQ